MHSCGHIEAYVLTKRHGGKLDEAANFVWKRHRHWGWRFRSMAALQRPAYSLLKAALISAARDSQNSPKVSNP